MKKFEFATIPFMGMRWIAVSVAVLLVLCSLVLLATRGLNYGIDFTGGSLVQLQFKEPTPIEDIRANLSQEGFGDSEIQEYGSPRDILVRAPQFDEKNANAVTNAIKSRIESAYGDKVEVLRIETVGPKIGGELRQQALYAVLYSLVAIVCYIWWRFELKFGLAAIIALVHDVIITMGMFSLTGIQFSLAALAAVLTVVGYSLNDTIVIFDRIRENLVVNEGEEKKPIITILNESITQTLSRTIITGGTTLFVVLTLFFFGGEVLSGFAFALIIGVIIGTFSSIFIATVLLVYWQPAYDEPHLKKLNEKPEEVV
ncbi:protein translocase subunit SecF [Chrysiogenes arsenatis]|uniref:protein translocase subunit SecF n=1 Tax=Chrysiogenes arsenatis TaxID=309797 RepID=UPI0004023F2A|nr:protein translocase subunit SecF [Chrysiogenes arsenatis]